MKLKSSILFIPFVVLFLDYDLFSIFSLFVITLIYSGFIQPSAKKIYLKIFVSLFFIIRYISSLFPGLGQVWINMSQKNYALEQKFIDIESVFVAFTCNFFGEGEFTFNKDTEIISCPHTVSYGPFFEVVGFKNNPFVAKYIFSIIVFILILTYYFSILKTLNESQSYIFSLVVLSPPVNFLLERMNLDIFIYISIYLAYRYTSKELHRNSIIFLLALMKYYPIFLIIGRFIQNLINKDYNKLKINALYLGIYFHLFIFLYLSESNILTQPVRPLRPDRTFGILSDSLNLSNHLTSTTIYVYAILSALILLISFILRYEYQGSSFLSNNMEHDLIVMFLIISLFANYDYRLAFLVLLLPSIIKTENKILNLSFLLFIFSSPGLMHSYGDLFQLVENYQFAYIDLTFYLFISCVLVVYLNYLKNNFFFIKKK